MKLVFFTDSRVSGWSHGNAHERRPDGDLSDPRDANAAVVPGVLNPEPIYSLEYRLDRLGDSRNATRDHSDGIPTALIRS